MWRKLGTSLGLLSLITGAACSGGDDGPGGASTALPSIAGLVEEPTAVGAPVTDATADASEEPHLYYAMTCLDGLLTIATTHETVYAELPCDRALPDEVASRFLGLPVQIRIVPSDPAKLYLESATAGTVEFTVGKVWIEER